MENFEKMTKSQLVKEMVKYQSKKSGSKVTLLARLQEHIDPFCDTQSIQNHILKFDVYGRNRGKVLAR